MWLFSSMYVSSEAFINPENLNEKQFETYKRILTTQSMD